MLKVTCCTFLKKCSMLTLAMMRNKTTFDFLGVGNATHLANFASACATNAINRSQAYFSMLVRGNVNTSDTCHVIPLLSYSELALTLFVAWISTNDSHDTFATNYLAVAAQLFDRSRNSHIFLLKTLLHLISQFNSRDPFTPKPTYAYFARNTIRALVKS